MCRVRLWWVMFKVRIGARFMTSVMVRVKERKRMHGFEVEKWEEVD